MLYPSIGRRPGAARARGNGGAWDPFAYEGLKRLFDGGYPETILTDVDGVYRWEDRSGNERHIGDATPTRKPEKVADWQNGLHGVVYDGAANLLDDETSNDETTTGPWTMAEVFEAPSTYYALMGSVDKGDYYVAHHPSLGFRHYDRHVTPDAAVELSTGFLTTVGERYIVVMGRNDAGNGFCWVNGVDVSSGLALTNHVFRMGCRQGQQNQAGYDPIEIGEQVFWWHDHEANAADMSVGLNQKWAVYG